MFLIRNVALTEYCSFIASLVSCESSYES